MSAPAVKTSLPGNVGNSTPNSTIMPMNMVAQKVGPPPTSTASETAQAQGSVQASLKPISLVQGAFQVQNEQQNNKDSNNTVHNGTEQQQSVAQKPEPKKDEAPNAPAAAAVVNPPPINIPTPGLSLLNNLSKQTPESNRQKPEEPKPQNNADTKETTSPAKPEEKKPAPVEQPPAKEPAVTPTKAPPAPVAKEESPQKSTPVKQTPEKPEKAEVKETKTTPPQKPAAKRKSKETKETKEIALTPDLGELKSRRARTQTTPYQSPLPEMQQIVKTLGKPTKEVTPKQSDEKLIVFYKNEFMAVRNTEGSFYVCQAMQNIYKSSKKIRIRWLSQDKNNGEIYSPDFYDYTDFDCILTNLNLNKVEKNKYQLTKYELLRTENILKRAIDVEAGVSERPAVTEENQLGLDLSLYTDEAQLQTKKKSGKKAAKGGKKQKKSKSAHLGDSESESEEDSDDDLRAGPSSSLKGPSRAERLLNRSKGPAAGGSGTSNQSATPSTSKKRGAPAQSAKKTEAKKPATPAAAPAKPVASPATPSTSGTQPKTTKSRGAPARSAASDVKTPPAAPAGGRQKRAAVTPASEEASTSRKKPRGRS